MLEGIAVLPQMKEDQHMHLSAFLSNVSGYFFHNLSAYFVLWNSWTDSKNIEFHYHQNDMI